MITLSSEYAYAISHRQNQPSTSILDPNSPHQDHLLNQTASPEQVPRNQSTPYITEKHTSLTSKYLSYRHSPYDMPSAHLNSTGTSKLRYLTILRTKETIYDNQCLWILLKETTIFPRKPMPSLNFICEKENLTVIY